jgi:predicted Zn-dependent protease
MMKREEVGRILDRAVRQPAGDGREVHVEQFREAVTRFANSEIHQNVEEENVSVRAIVVRGKRIGVASDNRLSPEAVDEALRRAAALAELSPEVPDFPGLAEPKAAKGPDPFDENLLAFDAGRRADEVLKAIRVADGQKLTSSGFLSTTFHEISIANSNGVRLSSRSAHGGFIFLPYDDRGSGYTERVFHHPVEFQSEALAREAVDRAVRSRDPVELPPGEYPVVLDTFAAADLTGFLGYIGLSALAHQEKRTFLEGKLGQKVFSEHVTLVDDPASRENPGYPFDWEGEPKARMPVFEKGVFRNVAHDRRTAAREGRASTGHGLPPPNPWGPFTTNLVCSPGMLSLEELARPIQKGVFVTRFHYTNVVDPRKGIITGMTRDGTFLIEKGEITRGIKNLRFTQALEPAFASVSGVGNRAMLTGEFFKVHAPALRLDRFTFTSGTKF